MDTLQDRLKAFIASMDMSVLAFENECGMSQGTVNKMTDKSRPRTLEKIRTHFPQLSMKWLIDGEGEMLISLPSKPLINIKDVEDSFNDSNVLDKFLDIIREKDRQIEELNQRIRQLTDKLLGL
ncbi:MAG: hypothetical protein K2M79_07120 [Muribaculaceae bacterium]|nr:hypothetical protein [Muribaculaceae bacterium]